MKKHLSTILMVLFFLMGLSVLLYPAISDYVNSMNQSRAIATYAEAMEDFSEADITEMLSAADAYNDALRKTPNAFYSPRLVDGYEDVLNVSGTGIMSYITIEKIDIKLPIYHTTDESVLQVAIGHLQGTSLPVGGAGTHSVLSGHRGLPSAKLFSNLDKLEIGDTFVITAFDRELAYQVDQIKVVLPTEEEYLQIIEDEDYCTLMTCTPYGINSHRILVRGTRVEIKELMPDDTVPTEVDLIDPIIVALAIAIPILLILLFVLVIKYRGGKGKRE